MMRAAIYARISTSLQNPASITSQIEASRRLASRLGATVVAEFVDVAASGATTANRPGLAAMMAAARDGAFEVVVSEALDRLTRSAIDAWTLFEDLRSTGIAIHTLAEGRLDELTVGIKGAMNALALREIGRKTRRGLEGVARDGRSAGGRPVFGYRIRREIDPSGRPVAGLRAIDPLEADVVRDIYTRYVEGEPAAGIVADLNARGVAGPRGRPWRREDLLGSGGAGGGLLENEIYRGVQVYGRHTWSRDHRTGKRVRKPASSSSVVRQPVQHLRIVPETLWWAAQAHRAETHERRMPREEPRPAPTPP